MSLAITGRACAVVGTLGRRGFPLENAAARICREAGGRVRTNVFVRDLDLGVVDQFDTRRLEVVVDGLPLFQGAQMAIDTTLVCPLTREGVAQPRTATVNGARLEVARRRKEARYPVLAGDRGKARLVVLAGEVGGRFSDETAQFPSYGVSKSPGSPSVAARSSSRGVATTVECYAGMCRSSCFCTLAFGQGLFRRGGRSHAFHARGVGGFPSLLVSR